MPFPATAARALRRLWHACACRSFYRRAALHLRAADWHVGRAAASRIAGTRHEDALAAGDCAARPARTGAPPAVAAADPLGVWIVGLIVAGLALLMASAVLAHGIGGGL